MIEVKHGTGQITITGHANYAPHGQDIVCASVSCLVQVFIESVEQLTIDSIGYEIYEGKAIINYECISQKAQTLLDSFFIGLKMIAESYPDHVQISTSFD